MPDPMTTIKVSKDLRARIARGAAQRRVTAAGLISSLLDEHDREARLQAVGRAYLEASATDDADTVAWDSLAGDGLRD